MKREILRDRTSQISFERARREDFPAIVRLNSANFMANLTAQERQEGFLSAAFTLEQTSAIGDDLGTMIAGVDDEVVGFLCAMRNEFDHGSPVVAKMLESYDRLRFGGKPLREYNSYIYGPVCIDRAYRGKGFLRGLYEAQKQELAGKFELGVALISRDNPHSLQAHIAGLGMIEAGDFEVKGNAYATVAFRVSAQ
jgi:hypothetical protein